MTPNTAGSYDGTSHLAGTLLARDTAPRTHHTGIVWGANIITMSGSVPVQTLRAGARVITRGQGAVKVKRIEQQSFVVRGVYILGGSLGHSRLDRDSLLPADQTVLVRDWRARALSNDHAVLMRAADLVDGEFVRDIGYVPMTVFRILCETPQVLYADGLELGSGDALAQATHLNGPYSTSLVNTRGN